MALTLTPTDAERAALERSRRAVADACTHLSVVAWDAQEFNRVRLQRLVDDDVRAHCGLLAQHTAHHPPWTAGNRSGCASAGINAANWPRPPGWPKPT